MIFRTLIRDRRGVRRPTVLTARGAWLMAAFAVVAVVLALAGTPQ